MADDVLRTRRGCREYAFLCARSVSSVSAAVNLIAWLHKDWLNQGGYLNAGPGP